MANCSVCCGAFTPYLSTGRTAPIEFNVGDCWRISSSFLFLRLTFGEPKSGFDLRASNFVLTDEWSSLERWVERFEFVPDYIRNIFNKNILV